MTRRKRTRWSQPSSEDDSKTGSESAALTTSEETTTSTPKSKASSQRLAPGQMTLNFWESEVGKSNTAERRGINNTPPEDAMARAKLLAEKCLQPIRDKFGAYSAESWYRCETLERVLTAKGFAKWVLKHPALKGATAWPEYFSRKSHPKGEAADIEIHGVDNLALFEWIRDNLEFDQLIVEGYRKGERNSGWIHISYREGDNRQQAFGIDNP